MLRGYSTTRLRDLHAESVAGASPRILDVRQPIEWRDHGIIAGSRTIFVADLPKRLEGLRGAEEITVVCRSGQRAAIAASILDGAGIPVRLVVEGGAQDWPTT
jgi:rhodanese-related sulfurtransferase